MIIPDHLQPLLEFVRGEGEWEWLGVGISTHPTSAAERCLDIHAGCVELEQLGVVERHTDDPDHVHWRPVGDGR